MIRILIACIYLLLICSCILPDSKKPTDIGVGMNKFRKANSIPILDTNWVYKGESGGIYTWVTPKWDSLVEEKKPFYGKKQVYISDTSLYKELDFYFSGQKFIVNKGTADELEVKESISINFNYSDSSFDVTSQCDYFDTIGQYFPSLSDAEKLLEIWQLKRLNY